MIQESIFPESLRLLLPSDPSLTAQSLKLTSLDQFLNGLTPGQVITGHVVERLPLGKAVVQFNEHRVAVDIGRGSLNGTRLQARVEQITPSPLLKLLSPNALPGGEGETAGSPVSRNFQGRGDVVRFSNQPQLHNQLAGTVSRGELAQLGLKPGARVTAEVIASQPDGITTVRVNGREATLASEAGRQLTPGSRVALEVKPQGDRFVLVTPKGTGTQSPLDLLRNLLPGRQPLPGVIRNLEQQVQEFVKQGGAIPDSLKNRLDESFRLFRGTGAESRSSQEIKNTVERSGLGYEAKVKSLFEQTGNTEIKKEVLRDFKGQLHELSRVLDASAKAGGKVSAEAGQTLGKHVHTALQNIEILQINHFIARQENLPLALLIPNMQEDNNGQFKIFYREDSDGGAKKDGEGKRGYNLVFLLDMSRLGKLRVDASVRDSQIDLNIFAENEAVLDHIRQGFDLFQEQLQALGFDGTIRGQVDPEKALEPDQEITHNYLENMNSLVDIRT